MSTTLQLATLGAVGGYGIRYLHEWVLDACRPVMRRPTVEHVTPVVPPSLLGDGRTPPNHGSVPLEAQRLSLILTKRCPEGYSAKQILGYRQIGQDTRPPQYPGGLDAWKAAH